MHNHECQYCQESFVCGTSADECFRESIVSDDCSFGNKVWRFIGLFILVVAAILLTLFLFQVMKR